MMEEAIEKAVLTAKRWSQQAVGHDEPLATRLLAQILEDPSGLDFTVEFVDGVIRPEDMRVAVRKLSQLTKEAPHFLPKWLQIPARLGGKVGYLAPEIVAPIAKKVFTDLVGELVLDVSEHKLTRAIADLREGGTRLNLNLLGEAVLGQDEADKRLADTFTLLRRDDVDYVSLKVSAITGPHSPWDLEPIVQDAVRRLLPLYEYAAQSGKFINLDMEEYKDLDLTLEVFETIMEQFPQLEAGIVVQAYLPDSLAAAKRLEKWAAQRVAAGGVPIKIRLVKGANLAMEQVDAQLHGWPLATWDTKRATDANYLRIIDWALTPERIKHVKWGIAGHNLFTLAAAWELAGMRGVRDGVEIEMLAGMAGAHAKAIREELGNILLYVPVVRHDEFDVAIAYLVRRLEENSAAENFMSSIFDIGTNPEAFEREKSRFMLAYKQMVGEGESRCHPNRTQNRMDETRESLAKEVSGKKFANTADTDPSLEANRRWAARLMQQAQNSELGVSTAEENRVTSKTALDERIRKARKAAKEWQGLPVHERAAILHQVGIEVAARRGDLIEVAAAELGKTLDESDPEISEAIDFAHYYADTSPALSNIPGATFHPGTLTLVTPPWNFPVSIPLGGVVAALAAGNAVLLKPATIASRCGAVLAECLWKAGVDPQLVQLVIPADEKVRDALITDHRVERVVLTGSSETAQHFIEKRPEMKLLAETSGKNSIIVTPSADYDLAVKDVVASAFGHAGQKCSAASLVILVGSVGRSRRFRDQLLDATKSLRVGWPTSQPDGLTVQMGPLSRRPDPKLAKGLSTLEVGQSWALQPRPLDGTGRLWSPGIRSGVDFHSQFQQIEYFGPLLGVIRVRTLEEAIDVQNGTNFGLTAGIQSLDRDEVNFWLDRVEAGNAYVNRSITGAIVRRQPFGGWKLSAVGPGAKAGGPNYLFAFGHFTADSSTGAEAALAADTSPADAIESLTKPQLQDLAKLAGQTLPAAQAKRVLAAALNAQEACDNHFDLLNDPSGLGCERNVLRYLPTRSILRATGKSRLVDILCIAAAAVAVGQYQTTKDGHLQRLGPGQITAPEDQPNMVLSSLYPLPGEVRQWASQYGFGCIVENDEDFRVRLHAADLQHDGRVRLLGAKREELGASTDVAVWDGPATTAARVEILPFVHEQVVSITDHRFGTPTLITEGILPSWESHI